LSSSLDIIVDRISKPEATLIQPDLTAIKNALDSGSTEIERNGFLKVGLSGAVLPCLILDGRVTASLSVISRSFDTVRTTRLMSEADVEHVVRKAEEQLARDNNPPGFLDQSNLSNFVFFRSVEAIGSSFSWLDRQKVAPWQKFVAGWLSRLNGTFRPLTGDELFGVGQVLVNVERNPTLLSYHQEASNIEFEGR
jgi:hypothetical protein